MKKLNPFQSTSPVWRTTAYVPGDKEDEDISIHVPRVEDDYRDKNGIVRQRHFNPRPPCGGRRGNMCAVPMLDGISIHVPRVEDDTSVETLLSGTKHFNPRPPCGGRQKQLSLL